MIQFIGLSGIGWILDFTVYSILGFYSTNLFFHNLISSWVGATFVFFFSTRTIFQNKSKIGLKWKYVIYLLYQSILIYLMSQLLVVVNNWIFVYITVWIMKYFSGMISKILVTPVTMFLNFVVMKNVIEKL